MIRLVRRRRFMLAAVCAIAFPQVSVAKETVVLAANTPWHLNYSEETCALARGFGEGDDRAYLYLEQSSPGDGYDVRLIGKAFRRHGLWTTLRVSSNTDPRPVTLAALSGQTADKQPMLILNIFLLTEPPSDPLPMTNRTRNAMAHAEPGFHFGIWPAAQLSELYFDQPGEGPRMVLRFGPMGKALDAMRVCTDSLVRRLGLDPVKQRALSRRPTPASYPGSWITASDYPKGTLSLQSAIIRFRLTVSSDGSVSGCAIPQATQGPDFAKLTCDLLRQRARFSPALDAEGKPTDALYSNSVRWLAEPPPGGR